MTQPDFTDRLFRAQPDDVRLPEFLSWLHGRGWVTSAQIESVKTWKDRDIRALAEASDGQIISGQKGYKLTLEATLEEIDQASGWYLSQAKKMTARAMKILSIKHGRQPQGAAQL